MVYGETGPPRVRSVSLDKAYDKLDGEEHSTFPELEYFWSDENLSLAQGNGLYIH